MHFMYGEIYRSSGNYSYANLEYKKALEYDTTTTILNAIGESYRLLGKNNLATDYFKQTLYLDPENSTAQQHISDLYLKEERFQEAIPILQRQLEQDPENITILRKLAESYRKTKQYEMSLQILDKMIALQPNIPWSYIYATEIMLENDRIPDAIPYLQEVMTRIPPNNELYQLYVRAFYEKKDYNGMLQVLETWLQTRPENLTPYFLYMEYQFQLNNINAAEQVLSMIKNRWQENSQISYYLGISAMFRSETDSVWFYFKRASSFPQVDIDWHLHYGLWFWEQGELERAEYIVDDAITRLGKESRWIHMKAMIRAQMGDFQSAEMFLKELVRSDTSNINAKEDLANIYVELQKPRKADSLYTELLNNAPENPSILNNYAYTLAQQHRRLEYAMQLVNKALKHENNAAYSDTKAWVLYHQEKYKKAIKWIEKALQYPDVSSDVHYHRGQILLKLQRPKDARSAFQESLVLNPHNILAKTALEELE